MAPPPPPELIDDLIGEILLRLPPEDPAFLVRSSLVCKPWHRLLSDGAFLRQYRAFHQTPPVLGFFQDQYCKGTSVPQYVPTIQASPVPQPAIAIASGPTTSCCTLDCRHGRVLFQVEDQPSQTLTVWDPITGNHKRISLPMHQYAVLCASDGCDHLGCSGGPFLVVIAGIYDAEEEDDDDEGDADGGPVGWASLYSSETGVWSASTSINVDSFIDVVLPSLLIRDAIYFILENGEKILKYGMVGGVLSVINAPPQHEPNMIFATAQDGELGAATVEFYSLHLWSWRATDPDGGIGEWVRCRVIELDVMIPISIGDPLTMFDLAGFAEGTGSIFISANDDIFTVELKSGQITKTGKRTSGTTFHIHVRSFCYVIFIMFSFFSLVTARLQVPMRTD
uniref:F-box domain n=1 Tax=Saccharum hybrid cultivar SP80-3280 TaxID=193079 RepID=A0A2R4QNN6_9POAL|nr:F-box domain [Saccharum hybrid cultivar SP80-3280]